MTMVHNRSKFLDKQHIKLQEAPESIPDGQTPKTVLLVCLDGFTDTVQPGYVCMYGCMYVHICVCMYICMYVCMCVYMYVYEWMNG